MSNAGWYPDPYQADLERYFDGQVWTGEVRAAVSTQLAGAVHGGTPGAAGAPGAAATPKSYMTTWILSLLFGCLGADRFYLGKTRTGVVKLLTVGGFGAWWLVDLIIALTGKATDNHGNRVRGSGNQPGVAWAVTVSAILLGAVVGDVASSNAPQRSAFDAAGSSTRPAAVATLASPASATLTAPPSQATTASQPPASTAGTGNTAGTKTTSGSTTGGRTGSGATASQQQAVAMARSYLSVQAFSRSGLIDQLKYEGFSTADATYGADHAGANWRDQAARMAREYLAVQAFSRSGLIGQLTYEGFSTADATYGVDQAGANWRDQAARMAREYLNFQPFSHAGLVSQLVYEGFTPAEAEYGVTSAGL